MKTLVKFFLIALFAIIASTGFGQGGFKTLYVATDLAENFKVSVPANSLVYVQSVDRFYNLLTAVGRSVNMTWVLADGSRYDDATVLSTSGTSGTYDTVTSVYGTFTTVSVGDETLTEGVNRIVVENSLQAVDSLYIGSAQYIYQQTINKLNTEGSFDVADTLFLGSAQYVWQPNINMVQGEGSIKATDTIFFGSAQYLNQVHINNMKTSGSIVISDTMGVGNSQYGWESTTNKLSFNNSISAADTVDASVVTADSAYIPVIKMVAISDTSLKRVGLIVVDTILYLGTGYQYIPLN